MSTIEKALAKQKLAQQEKLAQTTDNERTSEVTHPEDASTVMPTQANQYTNSDKEKIILNGDRLNERGFIYSPDSAHHIQEEFRHIKRKLLNNAFGLGHCVSWNFSYQNQKSDKEPQAYL